MYRTVAFMLAPLAFSGSANAQDNVYKKTDSGWEVLIQPKSCAMFADYASGTTLRISNRIDEDRLYVSLHNSSWTGLRDKEGIGINLYIEFTEQKRIYGSTGIILGAENDLGYSGGGENWSRTELLRSLAYEEPAVVSAREGAGPRYDVERFGMAGAREAVGYLVKCSEANFGGKPLSLPLAPLTAPADVATADPSSDSLRPFYPLLEQYRTCVLAAAARFSKTRETADLLARSALRSCAVARQKVSAAFGSVLGWYDGERALRRFDESFVQDAQLEIVRRRTP